MREVVSVIVCPLTQVSNLSFIQGAVPDDLKSARMVPLRMIQQKLITAALYLV